VPDIDGHIRVLAKPVWPRAGTPIVVVGQAVDDRDDVLASLVRGFALGGPAAVVVASVLGYLLAAAGLAPMEAMRRRASEVSLEDDLPTEALCSSSESLPLAAPDEPRWACPAHWLAPAMRGEGPTIWLDPEPVRVFAPGTIWLSARTEGGGLPGY